MGIVSGAPTVYDPRAGIQEDPVLVLLKKLLGKQPPVVTKAPDAGFRNNEQVYPTSGQALELPGRTLGAAPADRGLGGGGGGDVVVGTPADRGLGGGGMYPVVDVQQEFNRLYEAMGRTSPHERSMLRDLLSGLGSAFVSGTASGVLTAGSEMIARTTGGFRAANIPMTPNLAFDIMARQILPEVYAETAIGISRDIIDMITSSERALSDYLYKPVQFHVNEGAKILYQGTPATTIPDLPTATIDGVPVELILSANHQWNNYGEVATNIVATIVDNILANAPQLAAFTLNTLVAMYLVTLNPHGYVRTPGGRLRPQEIVNYRGMA